eukprot:CAMPEP_0184078132 /NCGR_PEP_ID=MMETSP0974-20121125/1017_1 /TAXON_ID=483370 /ORGANISM="non described non described, Strain CCMP2097" /LENGTH=229 /DNA_ID=CAMNT_0026380735 /DNA_START=114 /DNA_END=801 /DNA_ORIENTATION=+
MVMERWWDAWEERTLPDHAEVAALYEIWGRTGGRLKKWNKDTGWRPPPPKHEGNAAPVETDEIHRLYGGNLQYKPAHGVMWRRGRLAKVELTENGLEGTLPPQLSVLKECRVIALFGNNLTGTLQNLELSRTLTHLDLSRNKLEGTIPPSLLCSLPKLRRLHLEANKFSGELPSQLSTLSDMEEFTAQNNLVTLSTTTSKTQGDGQVELTRADQGAPVGGKRAEGRLLK